MPWLEIGYATGLTTVYMTLWGLLWNFLCETSRT